MLGMRYLVGLASLAAIGLLLFMSLERAAAASYNFPHDRDDTAATRIINSAAVRIFVSETGGEQIGSGFVIDSEQGLILTAAHVVSGLQGAAWVAFSGASDRHRSKILVPKTGGAGNTPGTYDLSILELDEPVDGVRAIEVQFDEIDGEQQHRVTGFGRSNAEPVQATVLPSKTDRCTYTLRSQTLYGDSGSALVTQEGLVDGVAVDGAESGGTSSMAEMKVLPLSCVRDQLLGLVSDRQSTKIIHTLNDGNDPTLRSAFQPPPNGTAWVSNLRLAKALLGWIAARKDQKQPVAVNLKRLVEAYKIIVERRLGYAMLVDFAGVHAANEMDAGDSLQQLGDSEIARGARTDAATAYTGARDFYLRYAFTFTPEPWTPEVGAPSSSIHAAKAYKGAADSMTKLAQITGIKDDFSEATSLAAAAVLFAPNGGLKASSWAALGAASNGAGDVEVAVPAYQKAIAQGATAPWVSKNLGVATKVLAGRPQSNLSVDFLGHTVAKIFK